MCDDLQDLVQKSVDATRELADEAENIIETLSNELERKDKLIENLRMSTSPMLNVHLAMWFLMFSYGVWFGVFMKPEPSC